jgi:hypothetical protein
VKGEEILPAGTVMVASPRSRAKAITTTAVATAKAFYHLLSSIPVRKEDPLPAMVATAVNTTTITATKPRILCHLTHPSKPVSISMCLVLGDAD